MSGTLVEERKTISFVPDIVTGILGSVYCLAVLFILLIIPILQVAFSAAYRNQCPINSNIPVYLIVSGACGIATILLTIVIAIAFICLFKKDSKGTSFITGCIIGIVFLILFLMSLFLSPWFIVGNVWIFGVYSTVDLDSTSSSNYCHRILYQFAFWILIVSYIMMVISCCCSCICSCFGAKKLFKK